MKSNGQLLWAGWQLDALALGLYALTLGLLAGLAADSFGLGLLAGVGWMLAALVWLGRVLKWCVHYFYPPSPSHEASAWSRWKHFGLLPLLALTLLGLSQTDWPQALAFRLHRPALERFAHQALAHKRAFKADAPAQRVGLYTIWRVEQVPEGIRFVTSENGFLDSSYSGFVFYPRGSTLLPFPTGSYSYARSGRRVDERWLEWKAGIHFD